MPEGTREFRHDRGMSMHRRAYDCRSIDEWEKLAPRIGINDPSLIRQVWETSRAARRAGMTKELAFPLVAELQDMKNVAEGMTKLLLGETVVTNDRVLNHVLTQAAEVIGRRDMAPLDKFETLFAFLLKSRREVLGEVDV